MKACTLFGKVSFFCVGMSVSNDLMSCGTYFVLENARRLIFAKLKIHRGASGVMTALWRSRAIARSDNTDAATWARMFILGVGVAV